ncbi:MAG: type II toxin-antitoxin system HicA family toxin [Thermodesulfobacteriota bacterium]
MNKKQQRTLKALFARPVATNLVWREIESLLVALGAELREGKGSRLRCLLHGRAAVFHRPHPRPTVDKGMVESIRRFLEEAGVGLPE